MKNIKKAIFLINLLASGTIAHADHPISSSRWKTGPEGEIIWTINQHKLPHTDHIEMSGKQVSVVLRYGVDEAGNFSLSKGMVWPLLRTIPNDTHASLMRRFSWNPIHEITINNESLKQEKVEEIKLKGMMTVKSNYTLSSDQTCILIREFFPAPDKPALFEIYRIINTNPQPIYIEIPRTRSITNTHPSKGVDGSYRIEKNIDKEGSFILEKGDTLTFTAHIAAYPDRDKTPKPDELQEKENRLTLVNEWQNNLVLETPDTVINRMFAFSKIRACESIYETSGGPMHGPGGESYYAAIWANDQAEYINPFFPFTGYEYGCTSAMNSFLHFGRYMNDAWKPIPSSIIAQGTDIWHGAGDRGDGAMIAYGAARYALARGSEEEARKLWPLITWCLEFCNRKLNDSGVVLSDSDELEGRFPSGKANLCTSSLYYDALLSAAYLAEELGEPTSTMVQYKKQATDLAKSIESYFGSNVEGFDTYAYYEGNDILRSWICVPLTVGIFDRSEETIRALFSPRLWTDNGLLTQAGDKTFWDRSTLYAIRGIYSAGEVKKATEFLHHYSATRLLGEHVPYAIEAFPEGGQRHLSAESGLYGRIVTEGLFGIRPTGFSGFTLTPRLPQEWNYMNLKKIKAFDHTFDIDIQRDGSKKLSVTITTPTKKIRKKIKEGESIEISLR